MFVFKQNETEQPALVVAFFKNTNMKKFDTDISFWQRSVIFYNNQIQALKNMPSSPRVQSLIAENQKELTRVTNILNGCYAK